MVRFKGKLEPVPHGGQFVVVPDETAAKAGVKYGDRVRGTVDGAPFRSSLARYSGVFHLGLHKAALAEAGAKPGAVVTVTLERDPEPLPTDTVPDDLAAALAAARLEARFAKMAPSHRREHVKWVVEAKKAETRAGRIDKVVEMVKATPAKGGDKKRG